MTVADDRHVVVAVEETSTGIVGEPYPIAADHVKRPVVEQAGPASQDSLAPRKQCLNSTARGRTRGASHAGAVDRRIEACAGEIVQRADDVDGARTVRGEIVRLLRRLGASVSGDEHRHDEPNFHEIVEQRLLVRLERRHLVVTHQQMREHGRNPLRRGHELAEGTRDIEDQRRVNHVAEIDEPRDLLFRCHDEIVFVQIAMDHLRSKGPQAWRDTLDEVPQGLRRDPLLRRVLERGGQFEVTRGHPRVPEQLPAADRSVKEAAQRSSEAGLQVADPMQQLGAPLDTCCHPSFEVREHVDDVLLALVGPEARRLATSPGKPRPRHGQERIGSMNVRERVELGFDHPRILVPVGHFHDPSHAILFAKQRVLITFTVKRSRGAGEREMRMRDLSNPFERQGGSVGTQEFHGDAAVTAAFQHSRRRSATGH